MSVNQVHNTPSTPRDLADTLMADTGAPHTSENVMPSQAPHPSSMLLQSEPNPEELVGQLLTDAQIYEHIFRPDRASYLNNLASMIRSSMQEINVSGLSFDTQAGHMVHNNQIQNAVHQASHQASFAPPPPPGIRAGSLAQSSFPTFPPSTNLSGMSAAGTGRPSDLLPFDNDPAQMSAWERQIALARSLLEVPVDSEGVFHADGFAASGADVEMLEHDMNATVPFMGPTSRS